MGAIKILGMMGGDKKNVLYYYFLPHKYGIGLVNELALTAENILALENPENAYIPTLAKVAATAACFASGVFFTEGANHPGIVSLGICDGVGSAVSLVTTVILIKTDDNFNKYKLGELTNYGVSDFKDNALELWEKKGVIKPFLDGIIPVIIEASAMLMDSYSYGPRGGCLKIYFEIINSIPAGNSKQTYKLLSDAKGLNVTSEEIDRIKSDGYKASFNNALIGVLPIIFYVPCYVGGYCEAGTVKSALSVIADQVIQFNINRMMTEQSRTSSFEESDRSEEVQFKASVLKAEIFVITTLLMKAGHLTDYRMHVRGLGYVLIFVPLLCDAPYISGVCGLVDFVYDAQKAVLGYVSYYLPAWGETKADNSTQ